MKKQKIRKVNLNKSNLHPEDVRSKALTASGITLVALIVTIIAITIMVGIVLNITTGDNGVLERAVTSTTKYTIGEETNKLEMWYRDNTIAQYTDSEKELVEMSEAELEVSLAGNGIDATVLMIEGNETTNNKARIKYISTNNMYEVDLGTGEITYIGQVSSNEDIEVEKANVSITYSTIEWTNENITAYITLNQAGINASDYRIKYYKTGDSAWRVYDSGFTISENCTIYAQVQSLLTGDAKTEWISSTVGNIDKTSPVITNITTRTSTATIIATDNLSGIAKYGVSTSASIEPTEWQESNIITGLNQSSTYYFWAKDNAGNVVNNNEETGTIGTPTFGTVEWSETTENSASVTLSGEQEECVLQYRIGTTGSWTTIDNGDTISGITSGSIVYGRLYDNTNESGTYASILIEDSTNPIVTLTADTGEYSQSVVLTGTATDNQSLLTVAGFITGPTDTPEDITTTDSTTITQTITANGTYYFAAIDGAGNKSYTSIEISNIDRTPPSVNITSTSSTRIAFTATDGIGVVAYAITTSSTAPTSGWTTVTSTTSLEESLTGYTKGTTYYVYAKDSAGNIGSSNDETGTIGTPTFGTVTWNTTTANRAAVTLTGTATDCVLQYRIGTSGTWTTITSGNSIPEQASGTTVYGRLYDNTNESGTYASIQIKDSTKPTVTLTSDTGEYSQSVVLTGTATDNQSLLTNVGFISATTDTPASITTTNSKSITQTVTANGTYYFAAIDGAGNKNYTSISVSNVDTTAPTVSIASNTVTTNSFNVNTTVTDSGTGLSKITWYYKLSTASSYTTLNTSTYTTMNGSTKGTTSQVTKTSSTKSGLTSGTYNVYAEVWDVAGNKATTSTINVTLGTVTAATSSNLTASVSSWSTTTATVTFSTTTSFSIQYSTNNSSWTTGTSTSVTTGTTVYARLTDGTNSGTSYTAITPTLTYSISYSLNSGTAGSYAPTSANYGSAVQISNPTRTGYTFAGWTASNLSTGTAYYGSSSSAISTAWTSTSTKPTSTYFKNLRNTNSSTVTLTANWTANTYTLTLNPNGGTYNSTTSNSTKTMTYGSTSNNSIGVPTRSGYTFNGWYTASSGGTQVYNSSGQNVYASAYWTAAYSSGTWKKTSSVTLYAQWTSTITYNANGGSGAPSSQTGTTITISSTKPTRSSYIFLGWSTSSSATAASYMPGSSYTFSSNTTLYAVWRSVNFAYTGSVQSVTLPKGTYKLQCWGAQGIYSSASYSNDFASGNGAYATGTLNLTSATTLYIYVGGRPYYGAVNGSQDLYNGGYNGGGASYSGSSYNDNGPGGGATDIALVRWRM